jgi:hydroxymethylbilane synthase
VIDAVGFLYHADTRFAVTAQRAALAALGGGCQVPIGIHCRPSFPGIGDEGEGPWDEIFGVVADPQTGLAVRIYHRVRQREMKAEELGRLAAKMLAAAGAASLLESDGEAE